MKLRFRGRRRGPESPSGRVGGGCHGPGRTSSLCSGKVGTRRVGVAGAVRSGEILDRVFEPCKNVMVTASSVERWAEDIF